MVSNEEAADPRLVWNCSDCSKTIKKVVSCTAGLNNPFNYNFIEIGQQILIGDIFTFSPLSSVGSGQALRKEKAQHSAKYFRSAAF
jgi:hypothetical protein